MLNCTEHLTNLKKEKKSGELTVHTIDRYKMAAGHRHLRRGDHLKGKHGLSEDIVTALTHQFSIFIMIFKNSLKKGFFLRLKKKRKLE